MNISLNKIMILTEFKFREILKNKSNIVSILLVLLLTFGFRILYANLAKEGGEGMGTFLSGFVLTLGVLYSVGMIALNTPAINLAKDKEKNTLRTLMVSSVNGMEYFISSILPIIVISIALNVAIIFVSGFPLDQINLPLYLIVSSLAAIISSIIGMIVGIFAKNQMSSSTIMTPIMLLVLMIPLLSNMSDTLKNISGYLYTGILANVVNSFAQEKDYVLDSTDYIVLGATIVLATGVFIYCYKKNGFEKD